MNERWESIAALFKRRNGPVCALCQHFMSDRRQIEALLPGFTALGSAYAAVAADDGICRRHDTYQSRVSHCSDFFAKPRSLQPRA